MIDCRTQHGCWRLLCIEYFWQNQISRKQEINQPVISIEAMFRGYSVNTPIKNFDLWEHDADCIRFFNNKGFYTGFRLKSLK
jgi:hypothetical protein